MSLFQTADSGTSIYRTMFPLKERVVADINIGKVTPLYSEFAIPGDIHHIKHALFIRTQAMLAPLLTDVTATVRCFFVPLRLIEDNTELIITGSKNGKFSSDVVIPEFKNIWADATDFTVEKYSVLDYMFSMPVGNYSNIRNNDSMPAQYWLKAWARIFFDWYRSEDLNQYSDFDSYWNSIKIAPGKWKPFNSNWKKDYFTSALPWQQKGIQPAFDISINNPNTATPIFPVNGSQSFNLAHSYPNFGIQIKNAGASGNTNEITANKQAPYNTAFSISNHSATVQGSNFNVNLSGSGGTFTMPDLRVLAQTQRVFERLARCGSRYTEYLNSNFGIAPADGTLQRAQYLGGFTQPIVTSEVIQTANDGSTPVGTLRGKGISLESQKIETFHCKEFGVILSCVSVMPKATYTQGIPRKYTYKKRFDFFNPSFQNLSEQEIRNGEVYIDFNANSKNDETFGFQEMYSELKVGKDRLSGDMRDKQGYWTMARYFSSTPKLSEQFITASDQSVFSKPFAITDTPPLIVEFATVNHAYRPMVRYGTPGLIDHN